MSIKSTAGEAEERNTTMNTSQELSGQPSGPCVMVVFGAGGDLTKRKLIPALYNLARDGLLAKEFAVVGFGRTPLETATFRQKMAQDLRTYATSPVEPALFQRADTVEAGWSIVTPILDVWNSLRPRDFPNYAAGTWGPREAEELLACDGRQWRRVDG
jgi:glucose-6-phosphate 1-dehydrogenase